jgi:hypothetical protein
VRACMTQQHAHIGVIEFQSELRHVAIDATGFNVVGGDCDGAVLL